jgi:hypothetical protein
MPVHQRPARTGEHKPSIIDPGYDLLVEIYVPNSAGLQNLEAFIRRLDMTPNRDLEVSFHNKWVAVHPVVLATVACAAATVKHQGGRVKSHVPQIASLPYLVVMRLFHWLGVSPGVTITAHEAAGRFIPLTQIKTTHDLDAFMVNVTPLLHGQPHDVETVKYVKYVISELVRNALEHAASPVGAFACAQFYSDTSRVSFGVADSGIGIHGSMSRSHPTATAMDAIQLALRPGITGTTPRYGGTEYNAGAGLFFTKAIAQASRNFFVIYSGDALFKLLKGSAKSAPALQADANLDPATRREGMPFWQGTVTGIDVNLGAGRTFAQLMSDIGKVYHASVAEGRKARYKKPRFA